VAHGLKGLHPVLQLPALKKSALGLEDAIRQGAPWQELARTLDRDLEEAQAGVSSSLQVFQAASGADSRGEAKPDPGSLAPQLRRLNQLLRRRSLEARREAEILNAGLEGEASWIRLKECLNRMDYGEAKQHLADLAQQLNLPLGD